MIVPRNALGVLVLLVVCFSFLVFLQGSGQWMQLFFGKSGPAIPYTTHIVLLSFKEATSPMAIKEITSRFMALRKSCIHPHTRRPYIVSMTGGKDISIENLQNGLSHAFLLKFQSNEDRDYYVKDDPSHQAFKEAAKAVLKETVVVDFQDGVFTQV